MKTLAILFLSVATLSLQAVDLVNDTWLDGDRTDPAGYAENNGSIGTDADADLNLESRWFQGGAGTLAASAGGPLLGSGYGGTSASWYTYFTPAGSPATLNNAGDQLKLTWMFTPKGTITQNANQGFNVALALTPASVTRPTLDGSVPPAQYQGYAVFMNMSPSLGNANPFQLRRWTLAGSGNLLGTGGNWTSVGNGATQNNTGFAADTLYTFSLTLTRDNLGGLEVISRLTGGSLDGDGEAIVTWTDAAASEGFAFDTFDIRPTSAAQSATSIETSLFRVELIPVPEPSAFALAGLGLALAVVRRNRA